MRLLLVEDDAKLADMLSRSLREHGYAVDLAEDGDRAYYQARINEYDGIVLDIGLPKRDGLEVSQALRKEGKRLPVLMLTARDAVRDRVAGLDAGADDYLVKPFANEELLARVRALIRRTGGGGETLEFADLELDLATRDADRAGRAIELSPIEF